MFSILHPKILEFRGIKAIINIMLKILNIISFKSMFFTINLDLEQVLSAQTYLFVKCNCIKMDKMKWSGQNMTKWEQGGLNELTY